MTKELQIIDCNCNDCKYMTRDFDTYKSFDHIYIYIPTSKVGLHLHRTGLTTAAARSLVSWCHSYLTPASYILKNVLNIGGNKETN